MIERRAMRILYVGWTGFGNLGDDVCRDLFIEHMRESLGARGLDCGVVTVTYKGITKEALLGFDPHLVVLGAGSLLTPAYLEPLLLAQKHGIPTAIWGTGFDKLPARLLDELLAGDSPKSLWSDERQAGTFRSAVDACAWAGVRGPHTLRILEAAGCASPPLHVCGDPGLLLDASNVELPDGTFPETWLAEGGPIIGINWGTANNNVYGGDERAVSQALAHVIDRLSRGGYKILLYGVWGPDLSPLRKLAAEFEGSQNVTTLRRVPSGATLAGLLRQCRFTINFKLHANVFSAAAGRPFVSVAYRSKCYDFAASLGCDDLVVRFNHPDLADAVLHICEHVERNLAPIETRIETHRHRYTNRIRALIERFAALSIAQAQEGLGE